MTLCKKDAAMQYFVYTDTSVSTDSHEYQELADKAPEQLTHWEKMFCNKRITELNKRITDLEKLESSQTKEISLLLMQCEHKDQIIFNLHKQKEQADNESQINVQAAKTLLLRQQEQRNFLIALLEDAMQAMKQMEPNATAYYPGRDAKEVQTQMVQLGNAIKNFLTQPIIKQSNTEFDIYVLVEWLKRLKDVIERDNKNGQMSRFIFFYMRYVYFNSNPSMCADAYRQVQDFVNLHAD